MVVKYMYIYILLLSSKPYGLLFLGVLFGTCRGFSPFLYFGDEHGT